MFPVTSKDWNNTHEDLTDIEWDNSLMDEGRIHGGPTGDSLVVFFERFALAVDITSKLALIQNELLPHSAHTTYFTAICQLLEVQELMEIETEDSNAKAMLILNDKYGNELTSATKRLDQLGCCKMAKRIRKRRLILLIELSHRLKGVQDFPNIQDLIETELGIKFDDPIPRGSELATFENDLPTVLDQKLILSDTLLLEMFEELKATTGEADFRKIALDKLNGMDEYLKEIFFTDVYNEENCIHKLKFSSSQRWTLLELFMNDVLLHNTNINGFLEVVLEDLKNEARTADSITLFGNLRLAHMRLSLPQLEMLIKLDPSFTRDLVSLGARAVFLIEMAAASIIGLDLDYDMCDRKPKVDTLSRSLHFLDQFSQSSNTLRFVLLYRKLELLLYECWNITAIGAECNPQLEMEFADAFSAYAALPRYDTLFANPKYVEQFPSSSIVWFCARLENKSTLLPVPELCKMLQYPNITISADATLIKNALHQLWSMPSAVERVTEEKISLIMAGNYLKEEKAIYMIKSGVTNIANVLDSLPNNGHKLSILSTTTELSFCKSNASYFNHNDPVRLFVRVRNIKKLTFHVYEVNTIECYYNTKREIRGDISLDGFLPNYEEQIDLNLCNPWQEKIVPINVPSIKGKRGVLIVEVLEGSITCRAILRKGYLRHIENVTAHGYEFFVTNENGDVLKNTQAIILKVSNTKKLLHSKREYSSDYTGRIVVPFRHPNDDSTDRYSIIFCHEGFGMLHQPFHYTNATFSLESEMTVDSEQLLPGVTANIIIRPRVLVTTNKSHYISVSALYNVQLTIDFKSPNNDIVAKKIVQKFASINELIGTVPKFEIPHDAIKFTASISANVVVANQLHDINGVESYPVVHCAKDFNIQRVTNFDNIITPHFLRRPERGESESHGSKAITCIQYYLLLLGHNGEPTGNVGVKIACKHRRFEQDRVISLKSNERGEILLGSLIDITKITIAMLDDSPTPGSQSWMWELPNQEIFPTQIINSIIGEIIEIPIPNVHSLLFSSWIGEGFITCCRAVHKNGEKYNEKSFHNSVLEHFYTLEGTDVRKNNDGEVVSIKLKLDEVGIFVIHIRTLNAMYPIIVSKKLTVLQRSENAGIGLPQHYRSVTIQRHSIRWGSVLKPIMIISQSLEKVMGNSHGYHRLQINLANIKLDSTKIFVILKRFLDNEMGSHTISEFLDDEISDRTIDCAYLEKRKVSDEYAYILSRRALLASEQSRALRLIGTSSLPMPSLVQCPLVVSQSNMEDVIMSDGEKITGTGFGLQGDHSVVRCNNFHRALGRRHKHSFTSDNMAISSFSFLGNSSQVVMLTPNNLADDSSSIVELNLDNLEFFTVPENKERFEIVTVAFDIQDYQITTRKTVESLSNSRPNQKKISIPKHDIRLSKEDALRLADHSIQKRKHACLFAGESKTINQLYSSKFAIYEYIESVIDVFTSICPEFHASKLHEQLKDWFLLERSEKLKFYSRNACDEINFFLYHKDISFFLPYIQPLIRGKLSKTFMDLYLLNNITSSKQMEKRYLTPSIFQRLSLIEKLLLAERISCKPTATRICKHVIKEIESKDDFLEKKTLSEVFDVVLCQGAVRLASKHAKKAISCKLMPPQEDDIEVVTGIRQCYQVPQPNLVGAPGTSGFSFGAAQHQHQASVSRSFSAFGGGGNQSGNPNFSFKEVRAEDYDDDSSEDISDDWESLNEEEKSNYNSGWEKEGDTDEENETSKRKQKKKAKNQNSYIPPGKIRMLKEQRYFSSHKPQLLGRNKFWRDYANYILLRINHDNEKSSVPISGFLSPFFPEAMVSLTEGIMAVSLLDLGHSQVRSGVSMDPIDSNIHITTDSNMILYYQSMEPGTPSPSSTSKPIVVKQQFIRRSDYGSINTMELDFDMEFVVNTPYVSVVTVSNVTPSKLTNLQILQQIPQGSIPLSGTGFYTNSENFIIEPNTSTQFKCQFYFPVAGNFGYFPAHVSQEDIVLAWANSDHATSTNYPTLNEDLNLYNSLCISVQEKPARIDHTSWNDLCTRGKLEDITTHVSNSVNKSLQEFDWQKLCWRCRDVDFYTQLIAYLRENMVFITQIWKYAILHNEVLGVQELLASFDNIILEAGVGIKAGFLNHRGQDIYSNERYEKVFVFEHTEFGPFIIRRAHKVFGKVESASQPLQQTLNSSSFGVGSRLLYPPQAQTQQLQPPQLFGNTVTSSNPSSVFLHENKVSAAGVERILNSETRSFYQSFCQRVGLYTTATSFQLLILTYFMILLQRLQDAILTFDRLRHRLETTEDNLDGFEVQYDYMNAYLDFFRPVLEVDLQKQFVTVRQAVKKHEDNPHTRWNARFKHLGDVLTEYDTNQQIQERSEVTKHIEEALDSKPAEPNTQIYLDATVKDNGITLVGQNICQCEILFYPIDMEFMFSTEPFDSFTDALTTGVSKFLFIKPQYQMMFQFTSDRDHISSDITNSTMTTMEVKIPSNFQHQQLMIRMREVLNSRTVSSVLPPMDIVRLYCSTSLTVKLFVQQGLVQVFHNQIPVMSCYVKVYAKVNSIKNTVNSKKHSTVFYKDGYTDLLGKFDYAAINGDLITSVEKFALLLSHDRYGAVVKHVTPPILATTTDDFLNQDCNQHFLY